MKKLKIGKNGELYKKVYNEKTEKHEIEEISKYMVSFLFDTCELDTNVSMRDIFLLCKKNISILSLVIRNYIEEWVKYGLNLPISEKKEAKYDNIEFTELCWGAEIYDGEISGIDFPDFNCLGHKAIEDIYENDNLLVEKGKRIVYGISSIDNIIDLPLKLNNNFKIRDENYKVCLTSKKSYRLIDIIYGIFWEISFNGTPEDTKKFWVDMNKKVEEIQKGLEDGSIKTTDLETLKKEFKNNKERK